MSPDPLLLYHAPLPLCQLLHGSAPSSKEESFSLKFWKCAVMHVHYYNYSLSEVNVLLLIHHSKYCRHNSGIVIM